MFAQSSTTSMTWLYWALLTVFSWGIYGVILHKGRELMPVGEEMKYASLKAFLFVCIAYAVIGVIAALMLKTRGSDWSLTSAGIRWSLIAGAAGAVGAFALVLSLMVLNPPKDGLKSLPMPFILGCVLAAGGAFLVAKYAPSNTGGKSKPVPVKTAPAEAE